jgi:hypothetical protein
VLTAVDVAQNVGERGDTVGPRGLLHKMNGRNTGGTGSDVNSTPYKPLYVKLHVPRKMVN